MARVTVFKHISLQVGGDLPIVKFRTQTVSHLLAYLALHKGSACSRSTLASCFWPDHEPDKALENLRSAWYHLRKATPDEVASSVFASDARSLTLLQEVTVDWDEFCAAHTEALKLDPLPQTGAAASDAIQLGLDPFLPNCEAKWAKPFRRLLEQKVAGLLNLVLSSSQVSLSLSSKLDLAHRALASYPSSELIVESAIKILMQSGHTAAAMRVFERFEEYLDQEWGELPPPSVVAALNTPLEACSPHPQLDPIRLATLEPGLLGREELVSDVCQDLLTAHGQRPLTLTGDIGVGKSSLLKTLQSRLPAGKRVLKVSLGSTQNPRDIIVEIASKLLMAAPAIEEEWGQIARALDAAPTFLLIDNAEHLMPEIGTLLRDLLSRTCRVQLIVTSRVSLGLPGGWEVELPVLRHIHSNEPVATVFGSPDFRLFLLEVYGREDASKMSIEDLSHAVTICSAAKGHPLSLVLAAAQVRMSSLKEVALTVARFEDRASPTLRHEQVTTSAAEHIQRSFARLSPQVHAGMLALAVFSGEFDEEDARIAADVDGIALVLGELVESRLISPSRDSKRETFSIHFGVRDVARTLLQSQGNWGAVNRRITIGLSQKARELYPMTQGAGFDAARDWVRDHERACLDAVLYAVQDPAVRSPALEMAFWLVPCLAQWDRTRLWHEALTRLLSTCDASQMSSSEALGHWAHASLSIHLSSSPHERVGFALAREHFEANGDTANAQGMKAYELLGQIVNGPGTRERAPDIIPCLLSLLDELRSTDKPAHMPKHVTETSVLSSLGAAFRLLGEHRTALLYLQQGYAVAEAHRFERALPILLLGMADNLLDCGDANAALPLVKEALDRMGRYGVHVFQAETTLARLLLLNGCLDEAAPLISANLQMSMNQAFGENVSHVLVLAGGLFYLSGLPGEASQVLTAAALLSPAAIKRLKDSSPELFPNDFALPETSEPGDLMDPRVVAAVRLSVAALPPPASRRSFNSAPRP